MIVQCVAISNFLTIYLYISMTYAISQIDRRHVDKVDKRSGLNESVESVDFVDLSTGYEGGRVELCQ